MEDIPELLVRRPRPLSCKPRTPARLQLAAAAGRAAVPTPPPRAWRRRAQATFQHFDVDGDGLLNQTEARARVPTAARRGDSLVHGPRWAFFR